jgi:RNA-directed DNA polymerase
MGRQVGLLAPHRNPPGQGLPPPHQAVHDKGAVASLLPEVIDALNPVLLGWGRFYQHCYGAKQVFARIDHYVWDRLRRWLRKKYPKTPRLVIRRRYWRRLPGRARYRWVDQRPVAIVADLKVGRHDLLKMRMPDYAYPARESPVHNERCTPGSGTGAGETGGGNPDSGASPPRSLRDKEDRLEAKARS